MKDHGEWRQYIPSIPGDRDYVQPYSGVRIYLDNPDPELINIEDIALGLSNIPRFTGQINKWYSVGEHCLNVSWVCDPYLKLVALLHDASEAYLNDLSTPIKVNCEDYQKIEKKFEEAIFKKFGISMDFVDQYYEKVKDIDYYMMIAEARVLCPNNDIAKVHTPYKYEKLISGRMPLQICNSYLVTFHNLYTNGRT